MPSRRAGDRPRQRGQRLEDPERLRVLRATRLLDSAPEESFDRLTRLTAHLLAVPVAQVALVEDDRQFFKSRIVTDREAPERQTGLDRSFCKYVVTSGEPLVVSDSRQVEILRDAPVSTDGEVIAYCGYPLRLSDGAILGTLCAVDRQPRDWAAQELELLADLSAIVVSEIELRRQLDISRRRSQDLADAASGLRALEGALEASSIEQEHVRAASLGLAATIAHEVRTPLFAIRGLAEVMLDEQEQGTPIAADVAMIDRTAQEALSLIDEQLQLARAEAGHVALRLAEIPAADVLGALRGLMRVVPRAPDVALVVDEPDADLPTLLTDAGKLAQVLRNLVSNALRHTATGEVRVSTSLTPDQEHVAFEVRDTGEGIDPADHERIFEPYTRLGTREDGTGLGLPLARRLAELLGGTVTVESALGKGSTFTATVAIRCAHADAPAVPST